MKIQFSSVCLFVFGPLLVASKVPQVFEAAIKLNLLKVTKFDFHAEHKH